MQKKIAAIAICLSEFVAVAPAAADTPIYEYRPATPTELKQCEKLGDIPVLYIDLNDGNPQFEVLNCVMGAVSRYDCQRLFNLASVSNTIRGIQGGTLNEKQLELEERRYRQVGIVYDKNCNFGF